MFDELHGGDRKVKAGLIGFGGCWLVGALLSLAIAILVLWGLWEGVQWLQRH